MKRVAVTGGSGQLGTVVLSRLVASPDIGEVLSIDTRAPLVCDPKIRIVYGDVRDRDLGRHFAGCDAVVHLAFMVARDLPLEEYRSHNVGGTQNVFLSAVGRGVGHVLYSSSISAYGNFPDHPVPIVEDTPRRCLESFPYGASKFEVEAWLDGFEREHPTLAITRLRAATLVGKRVETWLGWARREGFVTGWPSVRQPLVWDEDVAQAVLLAIEKRAHGAFNLTAAEELDPIETAAAGGIRVLGADPGAYRRFMRRTAVRYQRGQFEPAHPSWAQAGLAEMLFSSRKAIEILGWNPVCSTTGEVMRHWAKVAPQKTDRRLAAVARLLLVLAPHAVLPPSVRHAARTLIEITGPQGDDWTVGVDGGRLTFERSAVRPVTATATLAPSTLRALLLGERDLAECEQAGAVVLAGGSRAILDDLLAWFHALMKESTAAGARARRVARALEGEATAAPLNSARGALSVPPAVG